MKVHGGRLPGFSLSHSVEKKLRASETMPFTSPRINPIAGDVFRAVYLPFLKSQLTQTCG
jgi:hypothetical protein